MEADRWARVQVLFEAALDLDPDARQAFLDERCADDPELRDEVASLVGAHQRAEHTTFIERPAADITDPAASADIPDLIGRYRLVRRLGAGGMGTVYLGFRADDAYQQQVAIKMLRPELDSSQLSERFARERQILAQLEHPNIARLLDGGTAKDGRPFLVMEFVEGQPIDVYCRQAKLGVEARLALFRKVCAAVQVAHQNLIVHRDIKPANVLVGADGEPKLLDFGIAKLLDAEQFPMTVAVTAPGMRIMTPHYASPEQVRGAEITTASDIYSLGVLLYELLAGVRPFALDDLPTDEALRHVLEVTPFRPSTAALRGARGRDPTNAVTPPNAAKRRLARRLTGDLDTIALTALAKEPERRYASAEALARDLERHLRGLPVAARGDSVAYRASRFVRRNRLPVAIATLAMLGLLALSISLLIQRDHTLEQRDRATAVSDFMTDLFDQADPAHARGETITAREVLERGRERIDQLRDRPVLQADLLVTMGRVYRSIGLFEPAESMLGQALDLRRAQHRGDHAEVAECLELLGDVLHDIDAIARAEPRLREAVAMRRRLDGASGVSVAQALRILASALHRASRFDEARAAYHEAVAIRRRRPEEREELARVLNALGTLERDAGNAERSEALTREALALLESDGDLAGSAEGAWVLINLGSTLRDQGRYADAEAVLDQAKGIARKVYAEPHPRLSHALNELGIVLDKQGRWDDAEAALQEALALRQTVFGEDHPRTAETLNALANVALGQKDYARAEPLLERALATTRTALAPDHPEIATILGNLAWTRARLGKHDEAAALHEQAIDIYRRQDGRFERELAVQYSNLGGLAADIGDLERAITLREEAVRLLTLVLGENHPEVGTLRYNLGTTYHRAKRFDEARDAYLEALATVVPALGAEHAVVQSIRAWQAALPASHR